MSSRFAANVERLVQLVLRHPGETPREWRAAIQTRARRLASGDPLEAEDAIPRSLSPHVDAVLRHAYRITDKDVTALRSRHTDDEIFEVTVNAAVAAGVTRLERALALLKDGEA